MTTPHCGINLVGKENTPVVQKYLGQEGEFFREGKVARRGGAPEECPHMMKGAPMRSATYPYKYLTIRPKWYVWTNGVISFLISLYHKQ